MFQRDKWFENKWGLRIVSLIFTLMLFFSVQGNDASFSRVSQQLASVETTVTISDVPIQLGKHDADIYISQMQEKATVQLIGPKNIVSQLSSSNIRVVTEDLTNKSPGEYNLRLAIKELPASVRANILPQDVSVTISRKKTLTMPIQYELDENLLKPGRQVANVELEVSEVQLTGSEEMINKAKRVYIKIANQTPEEKSFEGYYKILVADEAGELLDVSVSINEVKAVVTVNDVQTKPVTLLVHAVGEREDYRYRYDLENGVNAIAQGEHGIISTLNTLPVYVDVTGMKTSGTIWGKVNLPEGVSLQGDVNVAVIVTIDPQTTPTSEGQSSMSENTQSSETIVSASENSMDESSESHSSE